ncbi:hypothetical protein ME1_01074 [Bartonella vinsonii subsp. arupensis OK-94-513]|uniref:Uncharacterized protein n=2 Tax=Bartonella vinsonii subsp. arupensis TaxID=110578 RepID=J1JRL4_BARVI|nr:hypothetical protein [Bartonella vinsonii]EJF87472.1 hypothetical protein ME1_01074 [Bartonella vinsonii subsp. arupensis OK-94-513]EJF98914.1 hypothetical protein MEI_00081 [Bartonella vinsonii subsp. arupensis Pm136co]
MLRLLLKLMTFIFVTLTIIVLVIDSAYSVSTSYLTITPLNKMLANLLQTDIYGLNQSIRNIIPAFLSSICIAFTCLPAWSILGALAIVCCILNHEKQKPFHKKTYIKEIY